MICHVTAKTLDRVAVFSSDTSAQMLPLLVFNFHPHGWSSVKIVSADDGGVNKHVGSRSGMTS